MERYAMVLSFACTSLQLINIMRTCSSESKQTFLPLIVDVFTKNITPSWAVSYLDFLAGFYAALAMQLWVTCQGYHMQEWVWQSVLINALISWWSDRVSSKVTFESLLQSYLKPLSVKNAQVFFFFPGEQISTHHGALAIEPALISLALVSSQFLSLSFLTVFASSISGVEIPLSFHLFHRYLGIVIREHNDSFYFGSAAANALPWRIKSSPLFLLDSILARRDRIKYHIWPESCRK